MKRKTIAAIMIAAALLIVVFFNFFQTKESPSFSIIGKWKLDTAYATVPVSDSIQQLIGSVSGNGEKNKSWYKFNADSIFNRLSLKDSIIKKYYLRDSVLYFEEVNGFTPYPLKTMTDSLVEFMNKDNIVFVLKKK